MENKGEIHFVTSDLTEINSEPFAHMFGIHAKNTPMAAIINFGPNSFIKHRLSNISQESLSVFLAEFKANTLPLYYKAEALPTNQEGPLLKLVRDNFNSLIINSDNHSVVAFINDSCTYCEEAIEACKEAKKHRNKNAKVDFGVFNIDRNDLFDNSVDLRKLPAIYLYKKGSKHTPLVYDSLREWDILIDFVNRSTGEPLFENEMPEEVRKANEEAQHYHQQYQKKASNSPNNHGEEGVGETKMHETNRHPNYHEEL